MAQINSSFSSTYRECFNLEITVCLLVKKEAPEHTAVERETERILKICTLLCSKPFIYKISLSLQIGPDYPSICITYSFEEVE